MSQSAFDKLMKIWEKLPRAEQPVSPDELLRWGSVDPYAQQNDWERSDQGKLALSLERGVAGRAPGTRVKQALAQLERPLPKGRDKYGQKKALRGWETEE